MAESSSIFFISFSLAIRLYFLKRCHDDEGLDNQEGRAKELLYSHLSTGVSHVDGIRKVSVRIETLGFSNGRFWAVVVGGV